MSVLPQTFRSSPEARNGGSLAVGRISLSPFADEGDQGSGRRVLWEDGERVFCRGWRLGEDGSRSAVLVVLSVAAHPSPTSLDHLAHEHGLKEELDGAWAVRPLEIVRDGGRTMLVLEDIGDLEPLERLLSGPMEVGSFLRLAIGIAVAVGKLHQRGLVHRDIKPANILLNRTGEVKLTGFGIASRLRRERQAPDPPETIAGTLAYMAPEQTGRMNRSIDSRSDLYALGVTLYQMLTGALPFAASDSMDLMHCQIARQPAPPIERRGDAPGAISAIIMKLLAKTAEERYQTAGGLEADLRRALVEWEGRNRIDAFPLGARDIPDQLLIPERLYGREREVGSLNAAFDRVVTGGGPELVLVAGQAGVGKSAVVHELHRALAPSRGLFASGKFDQLKRDIPYASLAQALLELIRSLLAKSEAELASWRAALTSALGVNGALMVALLPDLQLIIGPQSPAPELPPRDAQRRFQLVFRRLLGVFAQPEHPLALFLDDLQWLDVATLELLEDLLTQPDLNHLLLVGAYRDEEATPAHPLMLRMAAVRQAGGRVLEIVLKPLGLEDVSRIVADALHSDRARPLARLVHEKTAGNPFFAIQFLTSLEEEGLLAFDRAAAGWTWDLKGIRAKGYTDNVADLMLGKLGRLPAATRAALKGLACLGVSSRTATVAVAQGKSEDALQAAFSPAVRARLLLLRQEGTYQFLHDRVQEAAYALIPEGRRAAEHLAIGRRLVAQIPPSVVDEGVFEIVGQLNRGAPLIRSGNERGRLAELNLIAGRRAKASTAYASALTYLVAGAALLPGDAWEHRHDLAFALALNRAECEFLTGALAEAEARFGELADRAISPSELVTLTRLRVDVFMTLGRSDRAVAVGLECLRRLGIVWSAHPTKDEVRDEYSRLWRRLGDRSIEGLIDLPPMADRSASAMMDVLTSLVTPALFADENLRYLLIGRMVNISLEHGNSDASCYAYSAVGSVLGLTFGDYLRGFRFAQLGLDLAEQPGMERLRARVYLAFGNLAKPSARHVRTGQQVARHAFEAAQQVGDLTYAAISCNNLLTQLLASGTGLADVQREAEAGLGFADRARFGLVVGLVRTQLRLIRTLRGGTPVFGNFSEEGFDERRFERQLEGEPGLGIAAWMYWIRKLQARVLANDYAVALAAAARAERHLWMSPAIFERADYHFCAALALTGLCETTSAAQSAEHREALARHHGQLQVWAEHCPENFASHAALVGAETARLEGRELDAQRLYEQAIHTARDHGLTHNEAMAYERASAFYRAGGFEQIAALYLQNARHCYLRWGADGKVRQLEDMYPQLRAEERAPGPTSTIEAPVERLDLATVITVSQAVSSEIEFEKLIVTLLRTALEQAGAERGLLALARGAELRIEAEATTSGDKVIVHVRDESMSAVALPASLLNYVQRTGESVLLDDAAAHSPFAEDPHIRRRQTRSVLCLPLLNQAKPVGVLYLENNLAPRVFAPSRIAVLKLLASQAATALQNARLYRNLEEGERKTRRLIDANIIGISTWDLDGRILDANEAFLQMIDYSREDVVSGLLRWTDLTAPEWRDLTFRMQSVARRTGICQPYEKEYFRKDGSRVPVLVGSALFDEQHGQGVSFVLDLTERKRAEDVLRESESRLERAQRIARVGWWERDFATNRVRLSDEASRIFGIEPVDLPEWYDRWLKLVHPEDRPRAAEAAAAALRGGSRYDVEYRVVRPDGVLRMVHSQGDVTLDDSGRPLRQFGVMQDITELRQTEEALRRSEAYLAEAQRLSHTGTSVFDATRTVYWSEESYRIFGLDPLRGVPDDEAVMQRIHPDDRGRVREALRDASRLKREYLVDYRVVLPNGTLKHLQSTGHPLFSADGELLEYVATHVDVTERVHAQEQAEKLRQLESDLAHMNRLSIMGELTASLSHEILHPIATARNNARAAARFLDMSPPDLGEVRDALSCIVRDADRAKDIVGRVRDHVKKAPPRRDRFEVNEAIEEVIVMVRSAIDKSRVSVRTDFIANSSSVEGDRVQLQQVVLNLILNAIEAMNSVEEGARELSISTEQNQTSGVLIAVRDSGPGIDQEHFERVFDPFHTTKTSGLGMGLAICRSIIDAHGGRLWVGANEPRGAVFQFTLPAAQLDS